MRQTPPRDARAIGRPPPPHGSLPRRAPAPGGSLASAPPTSTADPRSSPHPRRARASPGMPPPPRAPSTDPSPAAARRRAQRTRAARLNPLPLPAAAPLSRTRRRPSQKLSNDIYRYEPVRPVVGAGPQRMPVAGRNPDSRSILPLPTPSVLAMRPYAGRLDRLGATHRACMLHSAASAISPSSSCARAFPVPRDRPQWTPRPCDCNHDPLPVACNAKARYRNP